MKRALFFGLFLSFAFPVLAQVDTVVVQYDSTFMSHLSRRLNNKRSPFKYTLEERGTVRDLAVFLCTLDDLRTGEKLYGVRIDGRLNRNLFTDAPVSNAEYIDEDELKAFVDKMEYFHKQIMTTDHNAVRYTEYRHYTRGGIALECYTGVNRWRMALMFEIDKVPQITYINNDAPIRDLIVSLREIEKEIAFRRKK